MMTRQIDFLASGPPAGPGGTLLRSLSTAGRSPHALRDLLSIVIPAPDGVFVAHLSKTENAVEVRTFIDSKSLNTDRKAIRDLMIQVSEPPLESPLSASPAVEFANLDYGNAFLTPVLCRRLAPHSDLLARCLFRQADEADHSYRGTPVREVQQWFQQQLSLLAGKADPYWEMFENAPLRECLTQANHILRQSYAAKTAPGKA